VKPNDLSASSGTPAKVQSGTLELSFHGGTCHSHYTKVTGNEAVGITFSFRQLGCVLRDSLVVGRVLWQQVCLQLGAKRRVNVRWFQKTSAVLGQLL